MAEGLNLTATVTSPTTARFEVTDPSMSDAGVNTTVTVYSDSSLQTVVTTVQTDQPLGSDSYGMGVATGLTPSTTYYAKIPQNTNAKSFTTFSGGKLYGPEKRLANIGSYTLEEASSLNPAVVSVDLATLKNFLNSQVNYIKAINSDAAFSRIFAYVAYAGGTYRCRLSLVTSETETALLRGFSDADYNTLVSTVRSNTGISLTTTIGSATQATFIVLDEITFTYNSRLVSKLYGPVGTTVVTGVTGTVRTGSPGIDAGIAFDGEVFYNYVKNTIDSTKTPDYLLMHVGRFGETYTLTLYYTDGTSYAFENGSSQIDPDLYGITWTATPAYTGDDYIDLTATTALVSLSKEIKKLYGSVNGQTKLVYQA